MTEQTTTTGAGAGDGVLDAFYAALLDDDAEELYDRAPCGYLSTMADGTIVKVNQTFLSLTGYERSELVGRRTFSELLTPGGRIYHETHYAPMLQMQGTARGIALDVVRADGQRLPTLVSSVLERDHEGDPVVIRTAVFDATERRQYEEELLRAKQRAEASEQRASEMARTLQQTLIPPAPPEIDGLELATVYRPAGDGSEVGGDFYDVFEVSSDDVVVVMGDVSGKGVNAAVVTALARYTIRADAVRHAKPSEMLATLNAVLWLDPTEHFCTVVLVRLARRGRGWRATISTGGHPLPILVRGADEPQPVGRFGSLLGLFETASVHDTELDLEAGDTLVLFTDGVTEGHRGRELYGEDRLTEVVSRLRHPPAELAQRLVDDVMEFQGGTARDDIAVVTIHSPAHSPGG